MRSYFAETKAPGPGGTLRATCTGIHCGVVKFFCFVLLLLAVFQLSYHPLTTHVEVRNTKTIDAAPLPILPQNS